MGDLDFKCEYRKGEVGLGEIRYGGEGGGYRCYFLLIFVCGLGFLGKTLRIR